jgi:hypothetical protein
MSRLTFRICMIALAIVMAAGSVGAVSRVSKRLGVFELYGGYSTPTGNIDHLGSSNFIENYRTVNIPASDVFGSSYTLGISFGMVQKNHLYTSVGFQFSHLRVKDQINFPHSDSAIVFSEPDFPKPNYNQYELRFNANYLFNDIEKTGWSPYLGVGLAGGLTNQSLKGYRGETEANIGLLVNFGAEVRIWQDANGRSLVTLASANSYEIAGSGYRPKYLTFGVAIKAYGRP